MSDYIKARACHTCLLSTEAITWWRACEVNDGYTEEELGREVQRGILDYTEVQVGDDLGFSVCDFCGEPADVWEVLAK